MQSNEAIDMLARCVLASSRVAVAMGRAKGASKTCQKEERTAYAAVFKALIDRRPTDEELDSIFP
jgi:hypothetical protein